MKFKQKKNKIITWDKKLTTTYTCNVGKERQSKGKLIGKEHMLTTRSPQSLTPWKAPKLKVLWQYNSQDSPLKIIIFAGKNPPPGPHFTVN